jgi:hypothetical protein
VSALIHWYAARRLCSPLARIPSALPSMTDASPENDDWLRALIDRSPVLADAAIKRHWRTLVPWLPTQARYKLAAILLDVELAFA